MARKEKLAYSIGKNAPDIYNKTTKSPRTFGDDDGTGMTFNKIFHHFEIESLPSNSAGLDLAVYQR